jgi:cell division protein YceG involved in septum cleavage
LDAVDSTQTALRVKLIQRYKEACEKNQTTVKVGALLDKDKKFNLTKSKDLNQEKKDRQLTLTMEDDVSTADIINLEISSLEDIDKIVEPLYKRFREARNLALDNTKLYLSIINDLDVYVATSMRSKDDFISMSKNCYQIFHEPDCC